MNFVYVKECIDIMNQLNIPDEKQGKVLIEIAKKMYGNDIFVEEQDDLGDYVVCHVDEIANLIFYVHNLLEERDNLYNKMANECLITYTNGISKYINKEKEENKDD